MSVEFERPDLVVEPRVAVREPPAHRRRRARRPSARAGAPIAAPAVEKPTRTPRRSLVLERVAERRAGRLPDARLHAAARAGSRPRPGTRGARRRRARRSSRRLAAVARADLAQQLAHAPSNESLERGPVLEVERPGAASRRPAPRGRPRRRRRPPRSRPPGSAAPAPMNSGSEVPISRWSKSPRACSVDPAPTRRRRPSLRVPGVEHAAGARVDTTIRASRSRGSSSSARPRPRGRACSANSRSSAPPSSASCAPAGELVLVEPSGERLPRCW